MGEMADWIVDQAMWLHGEPWNNRRSTKKTFQSGSGNFKWRTKEGIIDMRDMTDDHLINAIKICKQRNNSGKMLQLKQVLNERYGKSIS